MDMTAGIVIADRADAAEQIARFCQEWSKRVTKAAARGFGNPREPFGPGYPEAQGLAVATVRALGYDTAADLWAAEGFEVRATGEPEDSPYAYKVR